MYIRNPKELTELVARIRGAPRLAVDTEFMRERQYYPQLEIIQIATEGVEAILDYRALGTLEPFDEILNDAGTLKVFHAGYQDLEIFFNVTGTVPVPLFDTQVASAMVGFGQQIGYARLVNRLLGVSLRKQQTRTDWSRRPLTEAQIEYALNDVRYLLELHTLLAHKLTVRERAAWLAEEWEAMADPDSYRRVHPRRAWRHVSGNNRLRPKELAILRELAEWREREGIGRDRAPSLIIRDNVLLELARRAPKRENGLYQIRGLHRRVRDRYANEILDAIRRGEALPPGEWPRLPERDRLGDQEKSLVARMKAWLKARADDEDIAVSYLATTSELRKLVTAAPEERARMKVLRGWRRHLVGRDLLALLEGRASLARKPGGERMQLVYADDA